MTAKVQGLPTRLSGVFDRLNQKADEAVARLEKAEQMNGDAVEKIHTVAGELEENAKRTHQQIDDLINRASNGGPPLDEASSSTSSDAGEAGAPRPT